MTAQRIVLTSPWKLGLFVFLLVAGTGFGLLYAYLELFGGQVEVVVDNLQVLDQQIRLSGEMTVRDAYLVLGAVALLSLIGYIAVVTSARPLDRVVRGGRKREQALKRLGAVQDPREVDPEDFEDEPQIVHLLERWTIDAQRANDAQLDAASQRETLSRLIAQVRDAANAGVMLEASSEDPAVNALVTSINELVEESVQAAAPPVNAADSAWNGQRGAIGDAVQQVTLAESELAGFVHSVAQRAGGIAQVAQLLSQSDASGTVTPVGTAFEGAQTTGKRLTQLRSTLEELAEQANKLAITMALQLNRLGDAGNEMIDTVEEVRTLSTRYQRLVADLRLCENDHVSTLQSLRDAGGNAPASDAAALATLRDEAMVLDQNAEALREVLGQMRVPLAKLRSAVGQAEPPRVEVAAAHPAPFPGPAAPAAPQTATDDHIYEIAELGGHRIDEDEGEKVYELQEFGAVEL